MSDEFPALEGEVSMQVPAGEGEAVPEEAAAPEPAAAAPVVEMRKKKPCALYWKRPKSHLYEYNYGYGENYYKVRLELSAVSEVILSWAARQFWVRFIPFSDGPIRLRTWLKWNGKQKM